MFVVTYFINGLTSDFGLWYVDRHECKEQGVLLGFQKKIFFLGKWAILGLKMARFHNSGSAPWTF